MVECFESPAGEYFVPEWQMVLDMITRYLAVINSSSNFIIYCVAGKQFRRVFAILLHLKTERSIYNLAEVLKNTFSPKLLPFVFEGLFSITRATACMPDSTLVVRLAGDGSVQAPDIKVDVLPCESQRFK